MNKAIGAIFGIVCISVLVLSTVGVPAGSLNQSDEEKWNDSGLLYGINKTEYIHVYDFSTGAGEDKWAYKGQVSSKPPSAANDPDGPTDSYSNIEADDDVNYETYETANDNNYVAHRFNFSMDEATADLDRINVTWNGKGWYDKANPASNHGSYLYIWNGTSASYEELADNVGDNAEATLTGERTTSIGSYINAGNVTVLVVQNSAQDTVGKSTYKSNIATDYVKLVIHTIT